MNYACEWERLLELISKQIYNRARLPVVPGIAAQDNGFSRCEQGLKPGTEPAPFGTAEAAP